MEPFVVNVSCQVCGYSHSYAVSGQTAVVANSRFAGIGLPRFIQGIMRLPPSEVGQYNILTISVFARCPTTGKIIKVKLNEKALTEKGIDPKRVSLEFIGSEAEEQRGGK